MKAFISFLTFMAFAASAFAQGEAEAGTAPEIETEGYVVRGAIYEGDTIPWVGVREILIVGERKFTSKKQQHKWNKMKRDVKRVYPYAILASARLKEYNRILEQMPSEAHRKVYMKKAEEQLKAEFENELKKLTITQGRILIKLIDRETGNTSYELVKDLRGNFQAFMWQSVARIFGSNLKSEYDGQGDDKMIEDIIALIEAGEI